MATKLSSTLFGVVLTVGSITLAYAAPIQLSSVQMDSVSAGAIIVGANANASASGVTPATSTVTRTGTYSLGPGVKIGYGVAGANACCGAGTTATASTFGASNSPLATIRQLNHTSSTPGGAISAQSTTFVSEIIPRQMW